MDSADVIAQAGSLASNVVESLRGRVTQPKTYIRILRLTTIKCA